MKVSDLELKKELPDAAYVHIAVYDSSSNTYTDNRFNLSTFIPSGSSSGSSGSSGTIDTSSLVTKTEFTILSNKVSTLQDDVTDLKGKYNNALSLSETILNGGS